MSKQIELLPPTRGANGKLVDPEPITLDFTYTVQWRELPIEYGQRMERYMKDSFFGHELEVC